MENTHAAHVGARTANHGGRYEDGKKEVDGWGAAPLWRDREHQSVRWGRRDEHANGSRDERSDNTVTRDEAAATSKKRRNEDFSSSGDMVAMGGTRRDAEHVQGLETMA